ncbi:MAG: hypothetical protein IJ382_01365 [Flavobacteriales bacterium]|nr:hypothetical protein [Flavobacteriales bacterium]
MCITEEEYREEHKRALELLEEFKRLEAAFEMETSRLDRKTVKSVRKFPEAISRHKKHHRKEQRLALERQLCEFFESGGFDDGEVVFF